MDSDHLVPHAECTSCHVSMDGAFNPGGPDAPDPGDPAICGYCAEVMIYTEGLGLRAATSAEIVDMRKYPEFRALLQAVQAVIAMQ